MAFQGVIYEDRRGGSKKKNCRISIMEKENGSLNGRRRRGATDRWTSDMHALEGERFADSQAKWGGKGGRNTRLREQLR